MYTIIAAWRMLGWPILLVTAYIPIGIFWALISVYGWHKVLPVLGALLLIVLLNVFTIALIRRYCPRLFGNFFTEIEKRTAIERKILSMRKKLDIPDNVSAGAVKLLVCFFKSLDDISLLAYHRTYRGKFKSALDLFLIRGSLPGVCLVAGRIMDIAETKLAQMSTLGQTPPPKTVNELLCFAKEIHQNLNFAEKDALRLAVIFRRFGLTEEALRIEDEHERILKSGYKPSLDRWRIPIGREELRSILQPALSEEERQELVVETTVISQRAYTAINV